MKRHVICSALLLVAAACGSRSSTSMGEFDETGRPGGTYSVSTSIVSQETAQMDAARALERQGDYDGAIEALEGLYSKSDLDPQLREEVLLKLGELYGSWMNANRDYEKASHYLRQLLSEFPDTQHRERVTEMLTQYAKAAEKK
ncbi:MAG: tetratricopeptide repeat protein [Candidatus Latescibacterota bacterium]|nr:MAG: tetratricopeptide repeat protein [Candidatus Latescibacterota bacterium]